MFTAVPVVPGSPGTRFISKGKKRREKGKGAAATSTRGEGVKARADDAGTGSPGAELSRAETDPMHSALEAPF